MSSEPKPSNPTPIVPKKPHPSAAPAPKPTPASPIDNSTLTPAPTSPPHASTPISEPSASTPTPLFAKKPKPTPNTPGQTTPLISPKPPLSQKTKKHLLLAALISGIILLIAIATTVIILLLTRIDYAPALATAKDLASALGKAQSTSAPCQNVKSRAPYPGTTATAFQSDVDKCKSTSTEISTLVTDLENSAAVQKNAEIKSKFDTFKSAYDKTYLATDISDKLGLYVAYHNFILATDDLDYFGGNTVKELENAASYLTSTDNKELKSYGEKWLQLRKAVEQAYKAYYDADWSSPDHSTLYDTYDKAYDAYFDFAYSDPDWDDIAPLDTDIKSSVLTKFAKLYDAIITASGEGN